MIVGIFGAFAGYLVSQNKKRYREALEDSVRARSDAIDAGREARLASDRAREWEEKAQEKFAEIDEAVAEKLKEIAKEAEEQRELGRKEANEQLKIADLMNSAYANIAAARTKTGSEADDDFQKAYQAYDQATQIKDDLHEAWNNWGNALLDQAGTKSGDAADALFEKACEKYERAVTIKADAHEAWSNWGTVLLEQAGTKSGDAATALVQDAYQKCEQAEAVKRGSGAYNLGCVCARLGRKDTCREWLTIGGQAGTLPSRTHAMEDADLESVRDETWFAELPWADDGR